jgi:cell pole-organizing protein PopZ
MSGEGKGPESDPSMEDILASIRRILNEEPAAADSPRPRMPIELLLDDTMLADPGSPQPRSSQPGSSPSGSNQRSPKQRGNSHKATAMSDAEIETSPNETRLDEPGLDGTNQPAVQAPPTLANPETAHGVTAALRVFAQTRGIGLGRADLTIEDLIRQELRPLLQNWIDQHLAGLVERLVQEELTRLGNNAGL